MYYVYVIKSLIADYYYKGVTDNLERRLREHELGQNKFTKRYLPIKLTQVELCNTRLEARLFEKFFKSGFGREIIKEIDNKD